MRDPHCEVHEYLMPDGRCTCPKIPEFRPFGKIPRLNREVIVTEKIDGTNAAVYVTEHGVFAASRNRMLLPGQDDNHGFRAWVEEHAEELRGLGEGVHFGEWWGKGIGKRYPNQPRTFSLFNVSRWGPEQNKSRPACCSVVPVLATYDRLDIHAIDEDLSALWMGGSIACPGAKPEGLVVYHTAANQLFKVTCEHDHKPKSETQA